MQYSQEHLKTMVYAEFGGQTECIMGNWKIENSVNKASASLPQCNLAKIHWEQLLSVFNKELTLFPRYSHVFIPRYAPKPLHTITSITHYMEKN